MLLNSLSVNTYVAKVAQSLTYCIQHPDASHPTYSQPKRRKLDNSSDAESLPSVSNEASCDKEVLDPGPSGREHYDINPPLIGQKLNNNVLNIYVQ